MELGPPDDVKSSDDSGRALILRNTNDVATDAVYLFHGSKGSRFTWRNNLAMKSFVEAVLNEGFCAIILDSYDRDPNNNESWSHDVSVANNDILNIRRIHQILTTDPKRHAYSANANLFAVGFSGGGNFATRIMVPIRDLFNPGIIFCAVAVFGNSGGDPPGGINPNAGIKCFDENVPAYGAFDPDYHFPTFYVIAKNDYKVDYRETEANYTALLKKNVDTKLRIRPEYLVFPESFEETIERVIGGTGPITPATASFKVYEALRTVTSVHPNGITVIDNNGKFQYTLKLRADYHILGYDIKPVSFITETLNGVLEKLFGGFPKLLGVLQDEIFNTLEYLQGGHIFANEYNSEVIDFFKNHR